MQEKLKPCPFCGGDDIYTKYNGAKHGRFYYIECNTCGGRTRGACIPFSEAQEHEWDNRAVNTVTMLWNQRRGANAEQDH